MAKKWINIYLKITAINFYLKNKIVTTKDLFKLLYYSILTILFQLIFVVFTFPVYLFVSPAKVQEAGFILPKKEKDCTRDSYNHYCARRKISLGTFFGAGGALLLKILFIGIVSFFLLGGQALLAVTQNWTFTTPANYTYDSAKIEVTGDTAKLKDTSSPASGGTTNTGFDSAATDWTGVPGWLSAPGKSNTTNFQSSGGNATGYVDINLDGKKNNDSAGYWHQAFTTTANNPTATLDLDWEAITVTGAPTSYHLYAYIDTTSGNPTLGTEVWDSGNLTGASAWAAISQVDIASKVTTPGTYYLKIAAYHDCQAAVNCATVGGFDNVVLSWSGDAVASYATDNPTIEPTTSLTPTFVTSWDSFSETTTKNGGEIYYQLSDDDGVGWQYWNGSAWASAGASSYNIATDVNTNIGDFSTTNNKIMWKAFLESDGTQQVILDNVAITYTENDLPDIESIVPVQATTTPGIVLIDYDILDNESDPSILETYEYSLTGVFGGEEVTMTASTTHVSHDGLSGLSASPSGITHTFVWDAQNNVGGIYDSTVYVRLRANDGIGDGAYASSTAFAIDFVNPITSNVSAVQTAGTTNVSVTYDLSDDTATDLFVELDISEDSGSTWTATSTSLSGDVGAGVATGVSKTITWDAGTDFDEQAQADLRVRVRALDKFQNQGAYATSTDFTIDTLNPATSVTSNLQAQPNAGDTAVLIGGSFTETSPDTNDFYVAINAGAYNTLTAGDADTAAPNDQATAVGTTLDGNDYISKVKITHTDDFGQTHDNENLSPAVAYKYVKPYTPQAPTLASPLTTQLNLTINKHASEDTGLEYLIQETSTGNYVQANGTLAAGEVWQADSVWGTKTITGLSSPVANYIFQTKSRNPSDPADAASSESAYSATAQITNTAPSISYDTVAQTTDGTQYVTIDYTGTDGQGDINTLDTYQCSTNNSDWYTMTEKTGVDSDGISNLTFLSGGSAHDFMWDSGTDVSGVEDSTVYVRLRSGDAIASSTLTTSSAFEVDNVLPVVSSVSASQNAGARTVAITYDLADANNSTVEIDISDDGGSTWDVTDTTLAGDAGAGITPGSKTITWNAGTDFNSEYQSDIQVRVRALDTFGNQGSNATSSSFTLDTNSPVVSNVTGVQDSAADTFTFTYDVSEDVGNVTVQLEVSSNGGSTWTVPVTSASGHVGAGVVPGASKTITWDASVDYSGYEEADMQIRITADDQFTNTGNNTSSNFNLDSWAPRVTSVGAVQNSGTTTVAITYTLADINSSLVEIDISEDSGGAWAVTDTSVSGDIGAGIAAGSKTIYWDAGADFDEQAQADLRVRVRAKDTFEHQGSNVESADFSLDTVNPVTSVTSDLQAQPNAGDTDVLIGGSFTETNPDTNDFYVAINGDAYSSGTAGGANTASPGNQSTAVGATLDGNDYISKVKITHTDDFGQTVDNENTSPSTSYLYVKPYTPTAPTVYNPTVGTVDVIINLHASEATGLEYAIYESTQGQYVQANGTLGASAVWQARSTGAGQWGEVSGTPGGIKITGLVNDSYTYEFQTKSRNTSDAADTASSESALSNGASSANQAPEITIDSVTQTTNGAKYVIIDYTGSDLESETSSLVTIEYSQDNSKWFTMTEKGGWTGSDGTTGLAFAAGGTAHDFMWDVGTDLANTEDSTVYVRLQANDGTSNGNVTTSSAFVIDTKNPVISAVVGTQTTASNSTVISYTLTDLSTSVVEFDISENSGSTWLVATTTISGDIGAGVSPGAGKSITWGTGTDFDNQDQSDMRSRVRALDAFGNQGVYAESSDFAVDTKDPVVSNVSAVQNTASSTVTITYDISDTNNSAIEIDISENGGGEWTVADTSLIGDIGAGVASGTSKSIIWDAGADFSGEDQLDMRVRVRATDTYANTSGNVESSNFSLDTLGPVIANVVAVQTAGTDNVVIIYDLTDNSSSTIEIDISEDGGSNWNVTDTSVTGDVGADIAQGNGKSITWDAGTDFSGEDQVDIRVRVRGLDTFTNSSGDIESADFSLDTKDPATNATANLESQPNAGDTNALIGGSFTETNPNTNSFYLAFNGGAYGSPTAGDTNTATPSNQSTAVGATLDGNDYISKVKITHADDYAHSFDNENLTPNTTYIYVKPYTPQAPTVNSPQNTSVDVTINPNASEVNGLEYAIYESSTGNYVQAGGALSTSAVWQATSTWSTITVTGLTSPVAGYSFQVKSRNASDTGYAATSESSLSAVGSISNTAPTMSIDSVSQQTGGVNYVLINYTGTDTQNDTNSLTVYEYSRDNSNWYTMTEKGGVGSDGTSGLLFTSAGASFEFAWDSGTDLPGVEDSTVYVRLRSSDTLASSNLDTSSAFSIDNTGPVVSGITVSQTPGSNNIVFEYDLSDNSGSDLTVELDISEDSGGTWLVASTTLSGSVGGSQTAGADKTITWSAGTDFDAEEQSDMRVRIRALDTYGNQGNYATSSDFVIDTKNPTVTNVGAVQTAGTSNVVISYDLTDSTSAGHLVQIDISSNGGSTWVVTDTSVSGSVGAGQTTGTTKTITWDAGTDFNNQEESDMQVRVRSLDYFGNQGDYASSANFTVDTNDPVVYSVAAVQNSGTTDVTITYNISDISPSNTVEIDISNDGGSNWTVTDTSSTGDIGAGVASGTARTITWDADADFTGEYQTDMQVRVRATDGFGNIGDFSSSANFTIDTSNPAVSNVSASQDAGANTVTINYNLSEDSASSTIEIGISNDGGSTWAVASTTLSGHINDGVSSGISKAITWNAGTDFNDQYQTDMQVRVRATDPNTNQSSYVASSNFTVDTSNPVVSSVSAAQTANSSNVVITYNLADNTSSDLTVEIDISNNSGSTWTVTDTSVSGAVGSGQTTGASKTITWDAGSDFDENYQTDMQVRVRATDSLGNTGDYASSTDFTVDTLDPVVSSVSAVQGAGTTDVTISYDLTEASASSIVEIDISNDGGSTWSVTDTSVTGDIGSGVASGASKTITWDADTDFDDEYQTDIRVRVRATDGSNNISAYSSSANFTVDTANPAISNVSASQTSGTTNIVIGYDLSEASASSTVEIDISENGGSTWTVTDTSVSGDVGDGISTGASKSITWDAGTDFNEEGQSDIRVRIRAFDSNNNYGSYASSSNFSLDTINPTVNVAADLQGQANAGDTTALIGGSFTESSPDTNDFYLAINDGAYRSSTSGATNTASPSDQATATGATLDGNDYISKVRIIHTDDYGQVVTNEDLTPATSYKYVKPYTPATPTVDTPTASTVDVAVNKYASETTGLEYAIYESSTGNYVQADGAPGASPVWQTIATWGTKTVTGLSSPVAQYIFQIKSRNISDAAHAASSESALSAGASAGNTAPAISISSVAQTTDGTHYVTVSYTGTDDEDDTAILVTYEYSLDNSSWSTMTEKSGVGSAGTSSLAFTSGGASLNFAWDVGTDLANTEDTTVYVRLQAYDGIINGNLETSSAFTVDTKATVISTLLVSQTLSSSSVAITYNLTDAAATSAIMEIDISEDGGSTWTVASTSVSGDIGSGVTVGISKEANWDAGTDFDNEYETDMRVRIRATDNYGNQSSYSSSSNFAVDTIDSVVSSVTAAQVADSNNILITYNLADDTSDSLTAEIDISNDGGSSWTVTDTSVSGNVGASQSTGASKTITWDAETDFDGQYQEDMQVRVRAIDKYANAGSYSASSNFTVDTSNPVISNLSAVQNTGSTNVIITYDLADDSGTSTVEIDISNDGGSTWSVTDTTVTGNVGAGVLAGTSKTITWDADTDFDNQYQTDMQVRIRATDSYSNIGAYTASSNFVVDTANPTISNISAVQNPGSTNVIVSYDLADGAGSNTVEIDISNDGGSTWTVTDTSVTGDVGAGIASGTSKTITWDADTDFDNEYETDMQVRVRATDQYGNIGNYSASSNFTVNTSNPVISNVSAAQNTGASNVAILYDLSSASASSSVEINISSDGGSTWTVASTTVSGNIGFGVTIGSNKTIIWQAGTDFDDQYETDMQVRVRATDNLGNQGNYTASANFTVDTASPVITNVSAAQNAGSPNVIITYDLSEDYVYSTVELDISADSGATWAVTDTSVTGHVGSSVAVGNSRSITWDASTDFSGEYQTDIQVRVRATDNNNNQSSYISSSDFTVDTTDPVASNLTVAQVASSTNVLIEYDLADDISTGLNIEIDISQDGGFTWSVTDTSATGDISTGVSTGTGKAITWDAASDFSGQDQSDLRVRLRATDYVGNQAAYLESSNFILDTQGPSPLANLSKFSETDTSATLNWDAGVTDSNFNHYELWHGSSLSDVQDRSGAALEWDNADDVDLLSVNTISTVITGLSVTANYYVKIWAIDNYGNESTLDAINLYEETEVEIEPEPVVSGGPGISVVLPTIIVIPSRPILTPLNSPTNSQTVTISGLADPRSIIDLYDNGQLLTRLAAITDSAGRFSQSFTFTEGQHNLTARAVDFLNNSSQLSSGIVLIIDTSSPAAPIVQSHTSGQDVADETPELIGISEPLAQVEIIMDDENTFEASADEMGVWRFILPSQFALPIGDHKFAINATDQAGNRGLETLLLLTKSPETIPPEPIVPELPVGVPTGVPSGVPSGPGIIPGFTPFPGGRVVEEIIPSIPIPSEAEITEIAEAIELPGVPVPKVVKVTTEPVQNIFRFSGTALPNKDVVVYIHSSEALIYKTKTNAQGVWNIDHSQKLAELSPGKHSIFAVTIDADARVKSRPSSVSEFVVSKNFWVTMCNLLNLPTTSIVLVVIMITMFWLYRTRKPVPVRV